VRQRPGASRRLAGRLPRGAVALLQEELKSDRAAEDRTTLALLPRPRRGVASIVAQGSGVLSGSEAAERLARSVGLGARRLLSDGARVHPGQEVLRLSGDLRSILGIERTLLNALMHLSGVATATAEAVRAVRSAGGDVEVFATRKTLPGLRDLEKAAVVHGGGFPHRRDLSDGLLVKGTHLDLVGIPEAMVRLRRSAGPLRSVQVEVGSAPQALEAVRAGANALLLDNVGPREASAVVRALERAKLRANVWIELSGGITPATVRRYARTGADAVSLGALTHSARALPFHLVVRARRRKAPA
jgi:nicotinate-nucleotide pyrophosphorylase (carboxylating)